MERNRPLILACLLVMSFLAACSSSQANRAEQFFTDAVAVLETEPVAVESIMRTYEVGLLVECGDVPELVEVFEEYDVQPGMGCAMLIATTASLAEADMESVTCNEVDRTEDDVVMIGCDFRVADNAISLPVETADIVLYFDGDAIVDAYAPMQQ